jgi:hypothetical protein
MSQLRAGRTVCDVIDQLRRRRVRAARRHHIDTAPLPASVIARFRADHPVGDDQMALIDAGLRQWFLLALEFPHHGLGMPSRAVDDLWHEFVLHTRDYAAGCEAALGRPLHHVPDGPVVEAGAAHERLARTYRAVCVLERIDPGRPARVPLLFAVDARVGVPGAQPPVAECGEGAICATPAGQPPCLRHAYGRGRLRGGRDGGVFLVGGSGTRDPDGGFGSDGSGDGGGGSSCGSGCGST